MRWGVALAAAISLVGCVPFGEFACSDHAECDPEGTCESVGYCSFEDDACASGRRFSRFAPDQHASRCVEAGTTGWWDTAWAARRRLRILNGAQEGSLNGFPVLVVLDPTRIDYAAIAPGGADLRFVDNDGETLLAMEIEQWDPAGVSLVWVAVPRIEAASNDDFIEMYYGNPRAESNDPATPWTEGFVGVWHLGDSLADSTANRNDGVAAGTSTAPGQIGGGRAFGAATDAIVVDASAALADIFDGGGSASAWVFANSYGRPWYNRILHKASDASSSDGYSLLLADDGESVGTLRFARGFDEHAGWSGAPNVFTLGMWHHVAVSYDATVFSNTPLLYIDGEAITLEQTNEGAGDPRTDGAQPLVIGNLGSDDLALDGVIDEVHMARTLRTSDWIRAEFLNGTDAFLSFGAPELRP